MGKSDPLQIKISLIVRDECWEVWGEEMVANSRPDVNLRVSVKLRSFIYPFTPVAALIHSFARSHTSSPISRRPFCVWLEKKDA